MFAVAPSAGAWIEILKIRLRESCRKVAPSAGAWIEIYHQICKLRYDNSRSLRGSVD